MWIIKNCHVQWQWLHILYDRTMRFVQLIQVKYICMCKYITFVWGYFFHLWWWTTTKWKREEKKLTMDSSKHARITGFSSILYIDIFFCEIYYKKEITKDKKMNRENKNYRLWHIIIMVMSPTSITNNSVYSYILKYSIILFLWVIKHEFWVSFFLIDLFSIFMKNNSTNNFYKELMSVTYLSFWHIFFGWNYDIHVIITVVEQKE